MVISKWLTLKDVEKSNTAIRKGINNKLPPEFLRNAEHIADLYDKIYDHFDGNVYINSFFRGEKLNQAVGGSGNSQHCFAQAIDIEGKNGVTNKQIFDFAKTLDFDQIIDEFNMSWVHISRSLTRNRKQCLKAVKYKGKTSYLPI